MCVCDRDIEGGREREYIKLNETTSINYDKIQKRFQNVMLVGMASEISKNYTYKCVDRSRHNGIKGAKAKCAH